MVIVALRKLRMTAAEIAETLSMPPSTVSLVLRRQGMGRLGRIGLEPAVRYERSRPGELVHVGVKKLGRIEGGAGKRAFGDRRRRFRATYTDRDGRLAYAEVPPDERASTAAGFLGRALAFYRRHGIIVERVLTDNGSCYRATVHALACRQLGVRHLRTHPYRPQTNGKAERFIRTLING